MPRNFFKRAISIRMERTNDLQSFETSQLNAQGTCSRSETIFVMLRIAHSERIPEQTLSCSPAWWQCNFCGSLHCDGGRSPWWASREGPQHDRSRSDAFIIFINFNSYATLAIFFIISVLLLNTKLRTLNEC